MNRKGRYDKGKGNMPGRSEASTSCETETQAVQASSDEEGGDEFGPLYAKSKRKKAETQAVQASSDKEGGDEVDPWHAKSKRKKGFDYDDIIKRSGWEKINQQLIRRMEALTGGRHVHHLISRGIACSHRDMNEILQRLEKGEKFFLYTGRGPSSTAMHFGHAVPFILTKWLQDTFDVPLVIQITDDEKFLWRTSQIEEVRKMAEENIKDIISFGFDDKKTYIFTDIEYIRSAIYKNICRIEKMYTLKDMMDRFGFGMNDCIGKLTFPAIQAAPCFSSSFPELFDEKNDVPCLIPCAIDQDSIFRLAIDVAPKLGYRKPAVLHTKLLSSLKSHKYKMSASHQDGAVLLTDSDRTIEQKINNCENRSVLQEYLSFFMEDNEKYERISTEINTRWLTTAYLQREVIEVLTEFAHSFRRKRNNIDMKRVQKFKTPLVQM